MRRTQILLLALSIAAAGVCVRLGFWQLDRLKQRRARNAEATTQFTRVPVSVPPLGASLERYARVRATGRFDFSREFPVGGKARNSAPGVHIATPLVIPGTDTLLLTIRGWAYSPDAGTVDLNAYREPDSTVVEGYLAPFEGDSASAEPFDARVVRHMRRGAIAQRLHAPVAPYYLVITEGGAKGDSVPVRLDVPTLDEGPHLSYAVQWFLFATIFGAGGSFVAFRKPKPTNVSSKS